ncbi:MAG: VCBS repeat-containing protein [Gammaproteobacteria bacterium]
MPVFLSLARPKQHVAATAAMILAAFSAPQVVANEGFLERAVILDHGVDAPPLSFRLADGAGLLAIGRHDDAWRFSVIALADGAVVASGTLPDAAFFYDAGDPQSLGFDQICLLDEDGVAVLDPLNGTLTRITDIASIYHGRPWLGPTHSDFVRDVDDDGADDVLVPQFEGWLLARQDQDEFDRFLLEVRPRVAVNQTRISYEPRAPLLGDVDGDGLNDVVFLLDTELVTFIQSRQGSFTAAGRYDPIDAPLATETQRARWDREDGQVDQSDLEIEEVELVRDFDDDGILDLLTEKSISEGVFDRRSEYHLYLGRRDGATVKYAAAPDGSITSDGVQFDPLVVDVDGDGRMDIAAPSTKLGLARVVGALFSGRISVDLDVYRMRADGRYPDDSDYQTRFKVEFDLKTGLSRYPAVAIADFDGDGTAELMVQEEPDELTLYPGLTDQAMFGKNGQTLSLPLPRNGQMVEARDLDDDGRADLLVRYGPADGVERASELRVLLSEPRD